MARSRTWGGLVLAVLLTCLVGEAGAEGQPVRLGIRLNSNGVAVPQWVLAQARATVARVYAKAGIDIVWNSEWDQAPHLQLTMILTDRAPGSAAGNKEVLAVAPLPETGCGRIAYILWPRVEAFAHAGGGQAPKVLGRVMAHEIGHLLLGHNAHTRDGIMRAAWNTPDFTGIDNGAAFSVEQSGQMRGRIATCNRASGHAGVVASAAGAEPPANTPALDEALRLSRVR